MARRKRTSSNTQKERKLKKKVKNQNQTKNKQKLTMKMNETEQEIYKREKLNVLMKECIDDAKIIVHEKRLLESQANVIIVAIALFCERKKK